MAHVDFRQRPRSTPHKTMLKEGDARKPMHIVATGAGDIIFEPIHYRNLGTWGSLDAHIDSILSALRRSAIGHVKIYNAVVP